MCNIDSKSMEQTSSGFTLLTNSNILILALFNDTNVVGGGVKMGMEVGRDRNVRVCV